MTSRPVRTDPAPGEDPDLATATIRHASGAAPSRPRAHVLGVVVAEIFSPSEALLLPELLDRLGCPDPLNLLRGDRANSEATWWRLGALSRTDRRSWRAGHRRLPAEFDLIEFSAIRIGEGLCAVMAAFHPSVHSPALDPDRRSHLHRVARHWLAAEAPGFFAARTEPQPLIDLVAVAAGTPPADTFERVSHAGRTWRLWDHPDCVREQVRVARDHLVILAISAQLSSYLARYSGIRDSAQRRQGFVRLRHLEAQRENLLALSLNVSTVDRAVHEFNARRPHPEGEPSAVADAAGAQDDLLNRLKEADEQFRAILPVSASLASSMQALRASRVARWIAALSLLTSLLLLSLADTAATPRIETLLRWLTGGP